MKKISAIVRLLVPIAVATLFSSTALAQGYLTATGNPSFAVNVPVESGFINITNGNLHMEIPIATHAQRGALQLNERFVYDSKIWQIVNNGSLSFQPTNAPNSTAGWRFVSGTETGITTANSSGRSFRCDQSSPGSYTYWLYTTLSWTDPSGTNHTFDAPWKIVYSDCTIQPVQQATSGWATDASGYSIHASGLNDNPPDTITITDNNGTQVYTGAYKVIDRYGNYFSNDANGNLIDTVGRTPVIATQNGNITYYDVLTANGPINNNGTRVRYTVTTETVGVRTIFNEPGVSDFAGTVTPIKSIQLPDGSSYTFTYDSYGGITSVTLPTGGVITYGWINYLDSYQNENRWLISRTVGNNPSMTFSPSVVTQCSSGGTGCQEQVRLHKPSGDETLYLLTLNNGAWNTATNSYQGAVSGGQLLASALSTYNFSQACTTTGCVGAQNITKQSTIISLPGGLHSQTVYGFSNPTLGKLTSLQEWDYYTGSPSVTPTRETDYVYTSSGYDVQQVTVLDSNGSQAGQTNYGYTTNATAMSGVVGHGSANAGGPYLQTVSHWLNTGSSVTTTYAMDDTGQVRSVVDPKSNPPTTVTYQCANALLFQTTNALNQTTTYGYNCNSGALTSVKDPNDSAAGRLGTTYTYEAVAGRPWTITYSDGGSTTYTYPSSTEVDTAIAATPDPAISSQDITDTYGRPYQHIQAGVSSETTYDANGRALCVSNPHLTGSSTDGSTCITTYDGLDRPKVQTQQDNSTLTWSYSGNVTTSYDEAHNSWTRTSNAFGQLTTVVEPGNLQTGYLYDGLGNLETVTQTGAPGDTQRSRGFTYDWLSRLLSSATPETGTIHYSYPTSGSLCAGDVSLPCSKVDARGVTTTYTYDALNRLTLKHYSDGSMNENFGYDGKDGNGIPLTPTPSNAIGRKSQASNDVNAAEIYGYDPIGRIIRQAYCVPSDCSYSISESAAYDLAGGMTDFTYPDGHHIKQMWDTAGRIVSSALVDINGASVSQSYLQTASYFPDGSPQAATLGNGVVQTATKNNRLQIQSLVASSPLPPFNSQQFLSHTYCYSNCPTGGAANSGNIWQVADNLKSSNTQGYTYDSLSRITGFSLGGVSNQTYQPDSFGNLTTVGPGGPINTFSPTTNRISNLSCLGPGGSPQYDAAGNQHCDGDSGLGTLHQYAFDAENRISSVSNGSSTVASYIYDANGGRVRKSNADGTFTEYVDFGGQPMAERHSDGTWTDYIYANGQQIARSEGYDQRIHLHGTLCSGCSGGSAWDLPISGYVIKSSDKISWRQWQSATAQGGIGIVFTGGVYSNWNTYDTSGQVMNYDQAHGYWHFRTVDLSAFAGKAIGALWINTESPSASGDWDEFFADISIYSTDGTVTPLYHRQQSISLSYFGSGSTNLSATFERSAGIGDMTWAATTFYVTDHLGGARMEFAGGGWPVWQEQYTPFGQEITPQYTSNNYKFTGLERDAESNLDHAIFRQYSFAQNRWMSPDPYDGSMDLGNPQSLNRYSYVGNMPLGLTDPSGLDGDSPSLGSVGGCGGAVLLGGTNPEADAACVFTLAYDWISGLLGGVLGQPKFHGTTKPRPNSQPWDEYHIHYGPDIAGALGLPSGGCEFGACGGGGFGFQSPDCGCQPLQLPQVQGYPYWLIPTPFLSNWAQQLYDTMSQHGSGNQADTGVMQDVYRLYPKLPVCDALDLLLDAAKAAGDQKKIAAITKTKKAWGCKRSRASR